MVHLENKRKEKIMNFDEVCKRSGLQPETVRYYVESKLVAPLYTRRFIPEEGEYADEDVDLLLAIANLRRLNFSIDDIRLLLLDHTKSQQIREKHSAELHGTLVITNQRSDYLNQIPNREFADNRDMIDFYKDLDIQIKLPRRDINQDEGKKIRADIEVQSQQVEDLLEELNKSEERGKRMKRTLIVLIIVLLIALGWIIAPIWMVYLPKP